MSRPGPVKSRPRLVNSSPAGHGVTSDRQAGAARQSPDGKPFALSSESGTPPVSLVAANTRPNADIVIGASSGTLRGFLPAALGRLRTRHAEIVAHVVTGSDQQLLARLANRQVDLLIAREPVGRDRHTLKFDCLCAEPVHVVVRPHHPLSGMSHLLAPELSGYPIIVPQSDPVLAAGIERHLITEGSIAEIDPVATDSLEFAIALTQQSDCLLAIPQGAIEDDLQRRSLVCLPVDRPLPQADVGIVTLLDRCPPAALQILAQLMREVLRDGRLSV